MKKKLLILAVFLMTIGSAAAADPDGNMGNKYLVSDFLITIYPDTPNVFTANITNQNNGAYGEGYWEISTSPAANHDSTKVQQTGTFYQNFDTFQIGEDLKFTPKDGTTYYLLVYTNYIPEGHDNRVSKDTNVTEIIDEPKPT